jgi:tetratricopeptide (TPR) repeat protein
VLRFGATLRRYWISRALDVEIATVLRSVLDRPEARTDLRLYVDAANTALDASRAIDLHAGLRFGLEVIELARQTGDPNMQIEALGHVCGLYYFAGEPEEGSPFGAEAVELARRTGDDVLLAMSIMSYLLCRDQTHPEDGERLYAEAIACAQRSGDLLASHALHNNAAVHALRAGDFAAARAHLEKAAEDSAEIGEKNHVLPVNMGWVLRHERDLEAARASLEAGLRMSRRVGDRPGTAYCVLGLACLAGDVGDWYRAAELHGAAQTLIDLQGEPWQQPEGTYQKDSMELARERLGAERFDAAYARGTMLSFDNVMTLALSTGVQAAA